MFSNNSVFIRLFIMRKLKVFSALALSSWGYWWFFWLFHSRLHKTTHFHRFSSLICLASKSVEWNLQQNHQYPHEDNASAIKTFNILMVIVTMNTQLSLLPWGCQCFFDTFQHYHKNQLFFITFTRLQSVHQIISQNRPPELPIFYCPREAQQEVMES